MTVPHSGQTPTVIALHAPIQHGLIALAARKIDAVLTPEPFRPPFAQHASRGVLTRRGTGRTVEPCHLVPPLLPGGCHGGHSRSRPPCPNRRVARGYAVSSCHDWCVDPHSAGAACTPVVLPATAAGVEASEPSDVPAAIPPQAVSVSSLLLMNGVVIRVGDTEARIADELPAATLEASAEDRGTIGRRVTRAYQFQGTRFLLVFEPFERQGALEWPGSTFGSSKHRSQQRSQGLVKKGRSVPAQKAPTHFSDARLAATQLHTRPKLDVATLRPFDAFDFGIQSGSLMSAARSRFTRHPRSCR